MTDPGPWWQGHQRPAGPRHGGPATEWLNVGTLTTGPLAQVDPAGLVGPLGATWALDWWVGAEDRWHFPSIETAVRQELVDDSPLVETRMRVPGGDLVHRVYGAQASGVDGGRPLVLIEITNDTPTPVALALALRPHHPTGPGSLNTIDLDGAVVVVDGARAVAFEGPPSRHATGEGGASASGAVVAGEAGTSWRPLDDPAGTGEAAFVLPLPHRATAVAAVMSPGDATEGLVEGWADRRPDPARVASGWARQADVGARIEVPDQAMAGVSAAARRALLLQAPALDDLEAATDQAQVVAALAGLGHHDAVRPFVAGLVDRQRLTGSIDDRAGSEASTGAALVAVARWWRSAREDVMTEALVGPGAKAAHRIERRRSGRRHRRDPERAGLLPAGPQPLELGDGGMSYHDDWWSAAGQIELAQMLAAAGQPDAARDCARFGHGLLAAVDQSIDAVTAELDVDTIPRGPGTPTDPGMVGTLAAVGPLGVVPATDERVGRTLDHLVRGLTGDDGSVSAGARAPDRSARLTAQLAQAEIRLARGTALDRLDWLARVAGPSRSWPRLLDEHGHGAGGPGADPVAAAGYLLAVRQLLVGEGHDLETGRTDLELLALVPPTWAGGAIEAHDLPTQAGGFGFAVRWHDERPALLWELVGQGPVRITAPGLDPSWSTTEPVGEALLQPFVPVGAA